MLGKVTTRPLMDIPDDALRFVLHKKKDKIPINNSLFELLMSVKTKVRCFFF